MLLAIARVGESLAKNWHEDESSDCEEDHEKLQLELENRELLAEQQCEYFAIPAKIRIRLKAIPVP